MNVNKRIFNVILSFCALTNMAYAQEVVNDFQTRTSLHLQYKPIKKLKLSLSPEFRFLATDRLGDETYFLSKSFIETKAKYKASKLFDLGASYRFVVNSRLNNDTEYLSRYAFDVTLNKKYNRFYPSLRLTYSNYADDDSENSNFLRYKAAIKYDIPENKITPVIGVEAFHQLSTGDIYKMRYSIGADYKLFKNNYVGAKYKFDFYRTEYRNKHIISLNYKIKF